MQSNHLMAQEVLSGLKTARDRERNFPFVGDHTINSPGTRGRVETVFVNLEPLQPGHSGLSRIGNLREIGHDRTLVTGVDWVGRVAGAGTGKRVVPFCGHG